MPRGHSAIKVIGLATRILAEQRGTFGYDGNCPLSFFAILLFHAVIHPKW